MVKPIEPSASKWLQPLARRPAARVRLFCLPHAGGGTRIFRQWPAHLAEEIEPYAVHLPGRESRITEAPLANIDALVSELVNALDPFLQTPFVFLGHSFGALLAFELARRLRLQRLPLPAKLLVSACVAPQLLNNRVPEVAPSDAQVIHRLLSFGGTPTEVFEDLELRNLVLPAARADLAAFDSYIYEPQDPLPLPIAAFGGLSDGHVALPKLEAWRNQTREAFRMTSFPGGHFFIETQGQAFLRTLHQDLKSPLRPDRPAGY